MTRRMTTAEKQFYKRHNRKVSFVDCLLLSTALVTAIAFVGTALIGLTGAASISFLVAALSTGAICIRQKMKKDFLL